MATKMELLQSEIAVWKGVRDGSVNPASMTRDMCRTYYFHDGKRKCFMDGIGKCPIYEYTGASECFYTPLVKFQQHYDNDHKEGVRFTQDCGTCQNILAKYLALLDKVREFVVLVEDQNATKDQKTAAKAAAKTEKVLEKAERDEEWEAYQKKAAEERAAKKAADEKKRAEKAALKAVPGSNGKTKAKATNSKDTVEGMRTNSAPDMTTEEKAADKAAFMNGLNEHKAKDASKAVATQEQAPSEPAFEIQRLGVKVGEVAPKEKKNGKTIRELGADAQDKREKIKGTKKAPKE
jgi:hypothetical protein